MKNFPVSIAKWRKYAFLNPVVLLTLYNIYDMISIYMF